MRIVVAMDKFKGSLTAFEASRAVSEGLKDSQVTSDMDVLPISDGGEGTTAAVHQALGGELREVPVPNAALSRQVAAPVLFVDRNTERVAVMEMSAAAGLELLRDEEREPARASTKGVGEMIAFAQAEGADRIIIGIGGSATNDGGVGMAQALGFSFLDASGEPVSDLPACLPEVEKIVRPSELVLPRITAACDVTNPLLGPNGATYVYGPQKGARADDLAALEARMKHFSRIVERDLSGSMRHLPGAGAAGGLGFGLMAFLGATLELGFPLLADLLGIEERIAAATAVVTGEGSLDAQTRYGKAPMGVAEIARRQGKPVFAIGGQADVEAVAGLFDHVSSLVDATTTVEKAMANAESLLRARGRELGEWIWANG
jgi:glycerate kinase